MDTKDKIKQILSSSFTLHHCQVDDLSERHKNHPESKKSGNGGHFAITIIAEEFNGKTPLERHRMINHALRAEIGSSIHALAINADGTTSLPF